MDLSPSTVEFQPVDTKGWLGSKHGTDCTRTITPDLAGGGFTADYRVNDGTRQFIKSGTPVVKLANDLYGVAPAGTKADGHLFENVLVKATSEAAGAALQWHGVVITAQVPAPAITPFAAADGATHILYV